MAAAAAYELKNIEDLLAARDILRRGMEKSRDIALSITQARPRLEEMNQQLPVLEASIKTIARKCEMNKFQLDLAVGPAASVLSVFDAVGSLQNCLISADPRHSDLISYISKVKRLEEALRFLKHNCKLVIMWLQDVVALLESHTAVLSDYNKHYCYVFVHVKKSLIILQDLQATEERSRLHGGLLNAALTKLEKEFRHFLVQDIFQLEKQTSISNTSAYPRPVIQKLQLILERLAANNWLERCISIYVDVRTFNIQTTLQILDLNYLEISLSEFDSVQSIESYIDKWSADLEFVVKHLLELEHRACNDVFKDVVGLNVSKDCFGKTAVQCGLLHGFIKFANSITKSKKEAIKLLKLLDVFETLNKLRVDFNRLFGGKSSCVEIQSQIRDVIKSVINGACDIFVELHTQVESQRLHTTPPGDGGIPRLVSFVTDYSNELLSEYYSPILTQVLEIHCSWNDDQDKDSEQQSKEVHYKILKAVELNIQAWARTYKDSTISYIFLMNSHWYLCNNLKGTEVGELMGISWLRRHEECVEYYAAVLVRESWGILAPLLSEYQEGLVSRDQALIKRKIKAFTEAFDDMYRKQSTWVVPDKELRWKICEMLVKAVVPAYSNFITNTSLEEEGSQRCVKYSKEKVESMLSSLFQPCSKSSSSGRQLIGKIKNVVTHHFSSTTTTAAA